MKAFIGEVEYFLKNHPGLETADELTLYVDSSNRPKDQSKVRIFNVDYIVNIVHTMGSFTRVIITKCITDEN